MRFTYTKPPEYRGFIDFVEDWLTEQAKVLHKRFNIKHPSNTVSWCKLELQFVYLGKVQE